MKPEGVTSALGVDVPRYSSPTASKADEISTCFSYVTAWNHGSG